ncbi:MAG: amino acid ABC transporter permease [Spirochaetia bacterium]|jgi:polar amino acid transport system permease protein|nr:amino acid ABC transporter permease [Spirochaetia bacterium]
MDRKLINCYRKYTDLHYRKKDLVKLFFFAGFTILLIVSGTNSLDYNWQWYRVPRYIISFSDGKLIPGPLLKGLAVTLEISAVSLFFAFAAGLVTALFRLSDSVLARFIARVYLESVRNTPLLIQLFFIYFVLSPIFNISAFTSAVVALSLFEGAYTSEIIRAGIMSVPGGQWEAALSLGMGPGTIYTKIIFPQAIRQMLPMLVNQSVSLVKDSSLVSTIAIYDLTMKGQEIVADTFLSFEIWFTVALVYLAVTGFLSWAALIVEKKYVIGRKN